MLAIQSVELKKKFGDKVALENISLEIKRGSIHAILGPNGAGKTTFIKIMATLLKPSQGRVEVLGNDVVVVPQKVKELISLAGQSASVDEELTGRENLYLVARLLGMSASAANGRVVELLFFFSLQDAQHRLVKHYSGGMRRRLDIAASIIKTPEILFLDEPTTGLDPRSRNSLWKVIRDIAQTGTTVVLTTQYLEEADQLADCITVMDEGRIVSNGTADELKASVGRNILHLQPLDTGKESLQTVAATIAKHFATTETVTSISQHSVAVTAAQPEQGIEILAALERDHVPIKSYALQRPSLDEVFLALTGNQKTTQDDIASGQVLKNGHSESPQGNGTARQLGVAKSGRAHHINMVMDSVMLGWRSLLKVKHIPEQFMDVLITPVMFTFMFAFLFGGALAGSVEQYLSFLVPGMLVQTLTFNSVYSGMNIHTDIAKGIFDRFKSMPIWAASPFFGLFVGDCLRHIISGVFLLLFSMLIGFRLNTGVHNVLLALILLIAFALSVSWLFVIFGLMMRSVSAVMSSSWMLLMPLVFMSNIYASPDTMPGWLQTFIAFNPVTWQVDTTRMPFAGEYHPAVLARSVAASLGLTLALAPIAVRAYRRER